MKPAYDQLAAEYEDSSSVLIADVDCTIEKDLCSEQGVSGYPTIKWFHQDKGKEAQDYNGARDFDGLKKFVEEKLEVKCTLDNQDGCTDKEKKFITKMTAKSKEDNEKQVKRLEGMKGDSMKAELKQWVIQRLNIVKQIVKTL